METRDNELKCMCCYKVITTGSYYVKNEILLGDFIYYNVPFCSMDCVRHFLDVIPIHEQSCSNCGKSIGATAFVSENRIYCSEVCLLDGNLIKKKIRGENK